MKFKVGDRFMTSPVDFGTITGYRDDGKISFYSFRMDDGISGTISIWYADDNYVPVTSFFVPYGTNQEIPINVIKDYRGTGRDIFGNKVDECCCTSLLNGHDPECPYLNAVR